MSLNYTIRKDCRLCGSTDLRHIINFAPLPLVNEYKSSLEESLSQQVFPIHLKECQDCRHVQLPVVVDPNLLFADYTYLSGVSSVFVDHFVTYANSVIAKFSIDPSHLIVDVGSNDGTLLKAFQKQGMRVMGVDPAHVIAEKAIASGVPTTIGFFNSTVAESIVKDFGKAFIVTANNVFAHADDLHNFIENVKSVLHPSGVFVFEVSYFADVIQYHLINTIYHEHVSYHTVYPLVKFFKSHGMRLFDVEQISTHGGSIRCYVDLGNRNISSSVATFLDREGHIFHSTWDIDFKNAVKKTKNDLFDKLYQYKGNLVAFGVPAKLTTLIHFFDIGDFFSFAVDDNQMKQSKFVPKTGIKIMGSAELYDHKPEQIFIPASDYFDDIVRRHSSLKCKFITLFPEYRELSTK